MYTCVTRIQMKYPTRPRMNPHTAASIIAGNNLDGQLLKSECESLRSQLEGSRKREEELKMLVAQTEKDLRAAVEHQGELQQQMDAKYVQDRIGSIPIYEKVNLKSMRSTVIGK